jgi:opacity protein-like surface antigen
MRSKLISSTLTILSTALFASNAAAQDSYQGLYVNIGISQLSADLDLSELDLQGNSVDLGEETAKIIMINGRLGYRLNQYIAIEGDAGFGIGGDDFQRSIPVNVDRLGVVTVDADADLDVKSYFGIFARGILPVSAQFDIFLRGGYGTAKAEASAIATTASLPGFSANVSDSQSTNDFAYGIGAEYHINERHGIRADFSAIGSEAQFISVAYAVKF